MCLFGVQGWTVDPVGSERIPIGERRKKQRKNREEREREIQRDLMEENFSLLNQIQVPIYIMVTRSVKSGVNLTKTRSITPKL